MAHKGHTGLGLTTHTYTTAKSSEAILWKALEIRSSPPVISLLSSLCFSQTHTDPSFAKTTIPKWNQTTAFPETQFGFMPMLPQHLQDGSHAVSFFTTLPEAGVKGPGLIKLKAVGDWLQAQVKNLVKTELAAVNGCSLWFQGNEELFRAVGRHQTSLDGAKHKEGEKHLQAAFYYPVILLFLLGYWGDWRRELKRRRWKWKQ